MRRPPADPRRTPARERTRSRAAIVLVSCTTFLVALTAIDVRATYGAQTTADEPQYLLTAISIGQDLDLDIRDELEANAFTPFHEIDLDEQTRSINASGQRLSPHDPLLPAILAAPIRLFGWQAAKVTLAALAAATAAATLWTAVRRFRFPLTTATLVTGAFFASPPLVAYGTQVYPEIPAALCVIVGFAAATGERSSRSRIATLTALIALPWLGVKYVSVAAVMALHWLRPLLTRTHTHHRRRAIVDLVVLAIAGIVYLAVHQRIYGGWTVYAVGDHFVDGEFGVVGAAPDHVGRTRRLAGLIVDRGFGLAAWAPAFVLTPWALATVARARRLDWRWFLAIIGAGWTTATWIAQTMHGWWWPGRQVVVILPLVVLAMIHLATVVPHTRTVMAISGLLGATGWVWLAVEASTGRRTLIVDFGATSFPWYRAWSRLLPDLHTPTTADGLLTVVWTVAMLTPAVVLLWRERR